MDGLSGVSCKWGALAMTLSVTGGNNMSKKAFLIVTVLCVATFFTMANAKEYIVKDYVFTWYVTKLADVTVEIQKTPRGVSVILASPGGKLGRLFIPPSQTKAIGEVLSKTEEYHIQQKNSEEMEARDVVPAGDYKVTFSSSKSGSFVVTVTTAAAFSSAVLMNKNQALRIGKYLIDAQEMAALVDERINP